jgi:2-C-methyl-D-erythritol 4-phosphate cytidylyltransferase
VDLAVILAGAGEGRRMGALGPKLLLEVGGRTALARVVESFLSVAAVREIVAVVPPSLLGEAERALAAVPHPQAVRITAVPGGATRQESVRLGLRALTLPLPYVAVHDVARVLVKPALIERVLAAARTARAAIPAVPIHDSVKEVASGRVVRSIPRDVLQAAQTPQIFARDILARAHARALDENVAGTDDSMLVEGMGVEVAVVPGDPSNLKLTGPGDLAVLEALLQAESQAEA